jgi:hypothetical protein
LYPLATLVWKLHLQVESAPYIRQPTEHFDRAQNNTQAAPNINDGGYLAGIGPTMFFV